MRDTKLTELLEQIPDLPVPLADAVADTEAAAVLAFGLAADVAHGDAADLPHLPGRVLAHPAARALGAQLAQQLVDGILSRRLVEAERDQFVRWWTRWRGWMHLSAPFAAGVVARTYQVLADVRDPGDGDVHVQAAEAALWMARPEGALLGAAVEDTDDARRLLAGRVADELPSLLAAIGLDAAPIGEDAEALDAAPKVGQILRWDARAADYLDQIAARGQGDGAVTVRMMAQRLRRDARKRRRQADLSPEAELAFPGRETLPPAVASLGRLWHGWIRPEEEGAKRFPLLVRLAASIWLAELHPALGPEHDRRQAYEASRPTPVLVLPFARDLAHGRPVEVRDRQLVERPRKGEGRPTGLSAAPTADLDVLSAAVRGLHTLDGHRFIRWCATVAYHAHRERAVGRDYMEGPLRASHVAGDAVYWRVAGGYAALADLVGCASKKGPGRVKQALEALQYLEVSYDTKAAKGKSTLLYDVRELPHAPGRSRELSAYLARLWSPSFVLQVAPGAGRLLVPVLELPPMPVGISTTDAGPLAALDALAVAFLAEHSDQLATLGGAVVPWHELAEQAGVRPEALALALDRWTQDGGDGCARWTRDGERWTLADRPELEGAREVLLGAGRMRERARAAGRRGAAKRWKKAKNDGAKCGVRK